MRFLMFLLFIITAVGYSNGPAQAQSNLPANFFDPAFKIEDLSAKVLDLRKRADALRVLYGKLQSGQDFSKSKKSLANALKGMRLPQKPKSFRRLHEVHLSLAEAPWQYLPWLKAARKFSRARRFGDARTAAYQAYILATNSDGRAISLDEMAEIALKEGNAKKAANLYRLALAQKHERRRDRRLRSILSRFVLRITDVAINVAEKTPTACVVFSRTLAQPMPIKAGDYLQFEKPVDVKISAHGRRICINGLRFGSSHKLTILAGVPGQEGGQLYTDIKKTITVPNRTPKLILGSGTYVLPQTGDTTLPLKSINLSTAKLDLYLVHDRALVPFMGTNLIDNNLNTYQKQRIGQELGTRVWFGSVDIRSELNRETTTLVPVREIMKSRQPGIYALVASPPKTKKRQQWHTQATQWLVVTDIGLTTLRGDAGIEVFTRSLGSAEPKAAVHLKLIARNNTVLGEATTGPNGQARFPAALTRGKGGARPAALSAETANGDYAFLKLSGPALDLSDRGAKGRYVRGTLDAYLFAERGIYRPGEIVHLSGILRDRKARAVANVPLTLTLQRPDGVKALKRTLKGDALGGFYLPYTLSPGARSGRWQLTATAGEDSNVVGRANFQVDDFVPDRIAAELKLTEKKVKLAMPLNMQVQADFLYGAPAANLDGRVRISFQRDPKPYKGFRAFRFGLVQDNYRPEAAKVVRFKTDATGAAHITFKPEKLPDTSQSLRASILVEVRDVNGRPVYARASLPVYLRDFNIGIHSRADGSFSEDEPAVFDLVTLLADGGPAQNKALKVTWVREHYSYSWYRTGNRWRYRVFRADEKFAEENINSDAKGAALLKRQLLPGQYRIEVSDAKGVIASSLRFSVGWWARTSTLDTPDALQVSLKAYDLASGGNLQGFVKAPFAGKALIAVVSDRLLATKEITLAKDGTNFEIPVGNDWGPGAYVLATAYRPKAGAISRLPVRAMGLAWFTVDRNKRDHKLTLTVPEHVEPQQNITIPITLASTAAQTGSGKKMKLILAAVDEGILRLTAYKSPNPGGHYFGKQAFGLDAHDFYGRLIRPVAGRRGKVRSGAGAHGRRSDSNAQGITRRSTRAVALYQRDVSFDANGKAQVTLKLPDFNGALRLMAVAYGASTTAQGEAKLLVRQPLIAELLLPRFLAPGDIASATLSLQNLTDKKLTAKIALADLGRVLDLPASIAATTLQPKARIDLPVKLTANRLGVARLDLRVEADGLKPIKRNWQLQVRPAWPVITERQVTALEPGKNQQVDMGLMTDYFAGTEEQSLQVLAGPNLDPRRLTIGLQNYAYLCTEQTVSKGFPALMQTVLALAYGLQASKDLAAQSVERALIRLTDRQNAGGGFGIWSGFGRTNNWLNVHVVDFLTRAREAGYHVSPSLLGLSLNNLKQFTRHRSKRDLAARAYAHYILARLGEANPSTIRYFADNQGKLIPTSLGLGHLAAALQLIGEKNMAEDFFRRAIALPRFAQDYHHDYGSALRDQAGLITLLAETRPEPKLIAQLTEQIETAFGGRKYFNTQEMAWLLRAAAQLVPKDIGKLNLSANGKPVIFKGLSWRLPVAEARRPGSIGLRNDSAQTLRAIRTLRGVKTTAPAANAYGFEIKRTAFNLQGKRVPLRNIKQNNRYIILIQGSAHNNLYHDALVVDLLPAGLEIENAKLTSSAARQKYPYLPKLTRTEFIDARDDRFVAAINLGNGRDRRGRKFALAYVVRAVTPGTFVKPGIFIEDMYKPQFRAIGPAEKLTIFK